MVKSEVGACDNVAAPIAPKERLATLDVLRGFALLGIMFINVYVLISPVDWFKVAWQELPASEYGTEIFKLMFFQGKFYTLFAILFGLGFALQLTEAQQKSRAFALRFFWRIVVLWCIGMLHATFIWQGDILSTYAIVGILLLCCYGFKLGLDKVLMRFGLTTNRLPHYMILVAAFGFILGPLFYNGITIHQQAKTVKAYQSGQTLTEAQQTYIDRMLIEYSAENQREEQINDQVRLKTYQDGSYLDVLKMRWNTIGDRLHFSPFWLMLCGLFLIGTFLGRYNYIGRANEYRREFVRVGIIAFSAGMAFNIPFIYFSIYSPEVGGQYWPWITFLVKTVSGLGIAITFIVTISLLMLGKAKKYLMIFSPVGRMALTNYLMQSVVGTSVFYAYGFDLVGKVNVFVQLGYIAVLFTLQTLFCMWWLKRFYFGPAEWLWRSLTYMRLQPLRINLSDDRQVSTI